MRVLVALAALIVANCGARAQPAYPIEIDGGRVPLNRENLTQTRVGALSYAGGLSLTAKGTDSFGALSGLDVAADGRFVAVTDAGDLIRGRLRLDGDGRLTGVEQSTLSRLVDEEGRALPGKTAADAEDVTLLPDGGYAVSFEWDHRVVVYPAQGRPRRLPAPEGARLGSNQGLEALAYWRDGGGEERLVMGTEGGDAFACDLEGEGCIQILVAERDNPRGFMLTGLDALPDGRLVAVYRAASLFGGLRAIVAEVRPGEPRPVRSLAQLAGSFTVDNMEAIAAVPGDGKIRLYLASDDNFAGWQRTLLLAFDW